MPKIPVIIVTGASRGVGASVARWLGKIKAAVTLIARSDKPLRQAAEEVEQLGGNVLPLSLDVAKASACNQAVAETLRCFGQLNAVVNNAGIFQPMAPVGQTNADDWHYNVKVNLLGPVYLTMAAISELRKQKGRIINVSSGAANHPIESGSAYCASKAALNQFTRVLAAEESELTAVAIRPGLVDTQMQALLRSEGPKTMPPDQAAYYQRLKSEGALEPPGIPARSIAWLALHAPQALSGEFISYDDPRISKPALEFFGDNYDI
jgi:NAD(P)-dependent dehydrogenase (short-subunit alcohol dehydrogenase family)